MANNIKVESGVFKHYRRVVYGGLLGLVVVVLALPALLKLLYSPSQAEHREIVLLFSAEAPEPVSIVTMEAPTRLLFYFKPVATGLERELVPADDGLVERVRVRNYKGREGASLVVVYLARHATFEALLDGPRFVINIEEEPLGLGKSAEPVATAKPAQVPSPPSACNPREEPCECKPAFLAQNPGSFTLQLMSARQYTSVAHWFRDFSDREACYYRYRSPTGELWFSVVSGNFDTKTAAKRAIGILPVALRAAGPWLESVGSVQKRISESAISGLADQITQAHFPTIGVEVNPPKRSGYFEVVTIEKPPVGTMKRKIVPVETAGND